MKLKINDGAYECIRLGRNANAMAINDNVSTTRHDALGRIHEYESRWSLMNAFMRASRLKHINVVSNAHPEPITVRVGGIGDVAIGGIYFYLDLIPVETKKEIDD